ncbi:DUF1722 domain-containing protein [Clostridium bovifaecis]|uniref:DUF1722 domain-containing protein n=1 Tax=Clostridium bovifaecis TaxID=2184719 RepID=A0A6I6ENN8_9CLOT|nr:DUF1722 domain-containing protein [Clostridium bovifaecis]
MAVSSLRNFYKPVIVVSKCLGFNACRYNGQMAQDSFVEKLKGYVEFKTICPEVGIGLTTPRNAIRIVKNKDELILCDPKNSSDYTKAMYEFSYDFLDGIKEVDGFILKSRSPSCGIKDVKIYTNIEKGGPSSKGRGIFGGVATEVFPNIPIEDEGRLKDFKIREHFLTRLYTLLTFKTIKRLYCKKELTSFHNSNIFLFTMYNKTYLKRLNSIIKNINNEPLDKTLEQYETYLNLALGRIPRNDSKVKVLFQCVECFEGRISKEEKEFVVDTINQYKEGHIPYPVPLYLIKSYAVRFEDKDMLEQSFFEPYPKGLIEVRDSGKALN